MDDENMSTGGVKLGAISADIKIGVDDKSLKDTMNKIGGIGKDKIVLDIGTNAKEISELTTLLTAVNGLKKGDLSIFDLGDDISKFKELTKLKSGLSDILRKNSGSTSLTLAIAQNNVNKLKRELEKAGVFEKDKNIGIGLKNVNKESGIKFTRKDLTSDIRFAELNDLSNEYATIVKQLNEYKDAKKYLAGCLKDFKNSPSELDVSYADEFKAEAERLRKDRQLNINNLVANKLDFKDFNGLESKLGKGIDFGKLYSLFLDNLDNNTLNDVIIGVIKKSKLLDVNKDELISKLLPELSKQNTQTGVGTKPNKLSSDYLDITHRKNTPKVIGAYKVPRDLVQIKGQLNLANDLESIVADIEKAKKVVKEQIVKPINETSKNLTNSFNVNDDKIMVKLNRAKGYAPSKTTDALKQINISNNNDRLLLEMAKKSGNRRIKINEEEIFKKLYGGEAEIQKAKEIISQLSQLTKNLYPKGMNHLFDYFSGSNANNVLGNKDNHEYALASILSDNGTSRSYAVAKKRKEQDFIDSNKLFEKNFGATIDKLAGRLNVTISQLMKAVELNDVYKRENKIYDYKVSSNDKLKELLTMRKQFSNDILTNTAKIESTKRIDDVKRATVSTRGNSYNINERKANYLENKNIQPIPQIVQPTQQPALPIQSTQSIPVVPDATSIKKGIETLIADLPKDIKLSISLDNEKYQSVKTELESLTKVAKTLQGVLSKGVANNIPTVNVAKSVTEINSVVPKVKDSIASLGGVSVPSIDVLNFSNSVKQLNTLITEIKVDEAKTRISQFAIEVPPLDITKFQESATFVSTILDKVKAPNINVKTDGLKAVTSFTNSLKNVKEGAVDKLLDSLKKLDGLKLNMSVTGLGTIADFTKLGTIDTANVDVLLTQLQRLNGLKIDTSITGFSSITNLGNALQKISVTSIDILLNQLQRLDGLKVNISTSGLSSITDFAKISTIDVSNVDTIITQLKRLNSIDIRMNVDGVSSLNGLGKVIKNFNATDVDTLITQLDKLTKTRIDLRGLKVEGLNLDALKGLSGLLNLNSEKITPASMERIKNLGKQLKYAMGYVDVDTSVIDKLQRISYVLIRLGTTEISVKGLGGFTNQLYNLMQVMDSINGGMADDIIKILNALGSFQYLASNGIKIDGFKDAITGVFDVASYKKAMNSNPLTMASRSLKDIMKVFASLDNINPDKNLATMNKILGSLGSMRDFKMDGSGIKAMATGLTKLFEALKTSTDKDYQRVEKLLKIVDKLQTSNLNSGIASQFTNTSGVFDAKAFAQVTNANPLSGVGKSIREINKALTDVAKNNTLAQVGVTNLVSIFASLNTAISGLGPATTTLETFAKSLATVISGVIHFGTVASNGAINNIVVTGNTVAGSMNVVGSVANNLAQSQSNVANTSAMASTGLAGFGSSAGTATSNVTNLASQIRNLGNSMNWVNRFGRRWLTYYGIRRIFTWLSKGMESAGAFDKSMTMIDNTFKGMSDEANNFAISMNRAFMINPNAVRKNLSVLTSIFTNVGMDMANALDMSKVLTRLTYDMASAYDTEFDSVATAIRGAMVGQTKAIEKYGKQIEQSYVEQILLNEGIKINMSTVSNAEQMMGRYVALLAQAGNEQGFMAKMLETTTGKVEALKSSFTYLMSNISTIARYALGNIASSLLRTVAFMNRVAEKMMDIMGIKAELSGQDVNEDEYGDLTDSLDGVSDAAEKAKRSVASFDEVITLSDDTDESSNSAVINKERLAKLAELASKYASKYNNFTDMFQFDEDEITRVAEKITGVVTFISDHFSTILKTVGLIAGGMLAWKVGTGVWNIVTALSGIATGVGGLFGLGGATAVGAGVAGATGVGATSGAVAGAGAVAGTSATSGVAGGITGMLANIAGFGALAGAMIDAEENFKIFSKMDNALAQLFNGEETGFLQGLNGSFKTVDMQYTEMMDKMKMDWADLGVIAGATVAIIAGGPVAVGAGALAILYESTKAGLMFGAMMDGTMLPDYVDITKGVSNEAIKALEPLKADIDTIAMSISELWTGLSNPTDIDVEALKQNFSNISSILLEDAKKVRDEKLAELDFVKDALDPAKYQELVNDVNGVYNKVVENVNSQELIITNTVKTAKEEQRKLTEDELTKIRTAYKVYQGEVTDYASVTEKDVTVISENLANNMSFWTTKSVDECIKKSGELKEATIKSANDRYDNEVKVTEKLVEQGDISREEANKNIEKAKELRDETIKAAEESEKSVIASFNNADEEIGKVYDNLGTGWDKLFEGLGKGWAGFLTGVKNEWNTFWFTISDMWTAFWQPFKDLGSFVGDALDKVIPRAGSNTGTSVNNMTYGKIPKYATGGVVNRAHIGMIGEAGAEAIIPLERSQFIDNFASMVASKSQSNQPQIVQNITIKIDSTFDDDFQLREKARKIGQYLKAEQGNMGLNY